MTKGGAGDGPSERQRSIRSLWTDGAYEVLGARFDPISQLLVSNLDVHGRRVLDVATGTGNTAIAAALAGAHVEAFDLAPRLLDIARRRATEAGVDIDFREGDLFHMPADDDAFDLVLSTFGAFTADDPVRCADELVRVCRPDGEIVTTAWAASGCFDAILDASSGVVDDLFGRDGPAPRWWATRQPLIRLFAGHDVDIEVREHTSWLDYDNLDAAWDETMRVSAPIQRLSETVESHVPGGAARLRASTIMRWSAMARPGGDGVQLPATYAVATIRPTGHEVSSPSA